ncbi:23S rRNA (cytidine1920-2'-O)/16S rRNA (cytidine1409-2'-O)-methyltransferase [Enterococcus sp. PF1-24]|uniref:TlyA family RNA methyltransferase n=1 Tax=unclassified Enterococcus TaxID=2608891 RepID=UPI0024757B0D|nr:MULTISPECIES: TlyA family RNA methyltransferase [unclassified Enterococcus]MDH6364434.1 23S rRNA (cytidine1920-2'-O)/16S rRNA (cytidine1409-2'-O)-methyltransferase [Enterococcus sp. PFB1-1]MDH6401543.1 23S rRNA (cytidine1920-2'-O)/16S rRNA (cytidine1409-2'-O)-methyltransferase [Enterococcus sp. PF1-24]
MKKERVDVLAFNQGLFETREKAKRAVMAGLVYDIKNQRLDKPGEKIAADSLLHTKGEQLRYVSRGGLKLEKALSDFDVTVADKVILDIGASTGGFTDAALQNGAKLSYALDVGYNQLAWKIRQDERVVVMERKNFRYCTPEDFTQGQPEFATIDVSFISLKLILPPLHKIIKEQGSVIALIKPQFEAGREAVGKKGIVRDPQTHQQVLKDILNFAASTGYLVKELSFSPITGGEGNIEFLVHLVAETTGAIAADIDMAAVVAEAHQALKK